MKKIVFIFSMAFAIIGCREESTHETSTSSSSTSSTVTTTTSAKITVLKSPNNTPQKNISVLMFKSKPSITEALPTILKEVVTNDKGEAVFDLSSMVISSTGEKFYFGAFRKNGDSYVLLSTYFPELTIKKNAISSTYIIIQ